MMKMSIHIHLHIKTVGVSQSSARESLLAGVTASTERVAAQSKSHNTFVRYNLASGIIKSTRQPTGFCISKLKQETLSKADDERLHSFHSGYYQSLQSLSRLPGG